MIRCLSSRSGFTLVELLIVVVILGVLAAIAIPQFSSSTEEARLASLDTSLTELRNAIELYYHQHNAVYPGAHKCTDGTAVGSAAEADTSFVKQLMLYSAPSGETSGIKTATYKYGPYLKKSLPANPYNNLNTLVCDITETDISLASSGGTAGWKFYIITGRLIADDGAHDAN